MEYRWVFFKATQVMLLLRSTNLLAWYDLICSISEAKNTEGSDQKICIGDEEGSNRKERHPLLNVLCLSVFTYASSAMGQADPGCDIKGHVDVAAIFQGFFSIVVNSNKLWVNILNWAYWSHILPLILCHLWHNASLLLGVICLIPLPPYGGITDTSL